MSAARAQLEALSLDAKRVTDTLKNPTLTSLILSLVSAAVAGTPDASSLPLHTDKNLGNLFYAAATELPASVSQDRRNYLARALYAKRIVSRQQFLAASKFLASLQPADAPVDDAAFNAACGVGVVVSQETIAEAVRDAVAKVGPDASVGAVMKELKADARLTWADQAAVRAAVEAVHKPAEKGKKKAGESAEKGKETRRDAARKSEIPVLVEDEKLPAAEMHKIYDCRGPEYAGKRVRLHGWVTSAREAREGLLFCDLRDGTGCVQCVLSGKNGVAHHGLIEQTGLLVRETSIEVTGTLAKFPEKHTPSDRQPRTIDYELQVDWWKLVGKSDVDIETLVTKDSDVSRRFDYRHIDLRSPRGFVTLQVRNAMLFEFRRWYQEHEFCEVTPPTIVETFCEGGSNLFKLDYYGKPAYLTQSSQLYLETVLPVVGNTYCILPSYRAEVSRTPRHLSEFTHMEAELSFICFEDLLNHLEEMICDVCEATYKRVGDLIRTRNPNFKVPKRPFRRMTYGDAIKYCNEHGILNNETGKPFVYGEDITEKPERAMTDMIGEPVFMTRFPIEMKAFYMKKCPDNPRETESVDLLIPGVGEIVGASMRISDYDELMAAYKRVGIPAEPYYWFTDQRKYGSVPHGGYGIGTERLLMWMLADEHIRNIPLYPRYVGRCSP